LEFQSTVTLDHVHSVIEMKFIHDPDFILLQTFPHVEYRGKKKKK